MKVRGDGSIIQRDKSKPRGKCREWELSLQVEAGGRRMRKTRAFHGTYTQAKAAMDDFKSDVADIVPPSGYTFGQYARRWHQRRAESGRFAPKTMAAEQTRVERLCRAIGGLALEDVTPDAVADLYASWSWSYAWSTMRLTHMTLKSMMKRAFGDGLVASNPCDGVEVPGRKPASTKKALSQAEMDALAHALDPADGRQRAALLCLTCGLRRSEVIALRWSDWDGESVHVERADDGTGHDKPPKTDAGIRTVPAPSWLAPVLDGLRGEPGEPMCADAWGRRIRYSSIGAWWERERESFGADCTMHELRHSYLTQLARAGVHPRVMMRLAGHGSMAVCMEIYTHVGEDMQREAVRKAFG